MASDHQRLIAESLLKAEKKYDELKKIDNKIIYDLSHKLEAIRNLIERQNAKDYRKDEIDYYEVGMVSITDIEEILEAGE